MKLWNNRYNCNYGGNMKKSFLDKILAGLSMGIVVSLIPGALLGELMKALLPVFPQASIVLQMTSIATSMMPMVIGVCIAIQFGFTPIQTTSMGIAAVVGSGVVKMIEVDGGKSVMSIAGTGDVINTAITAAIAAGIILLLGNQLKAYTILLIPMIVVVVGGGLGLFTLPYVAKLTAVVGEIIMKMTLAQPIVMGALISLSFAFLILSPFSTVAVAVAISLAGVGSGAANLGVVAAGFGLAILGWKKNSVGTSIAHFLGSPKMQMANFVKKPIMAVPIFANALILGVLAAIFNIQGTPMSAGFGISGLIGPINAINTGSSIAIVVLVFVVAPVALAILFDRVFKKMIPLVKDDDYKIDFE